MKAWMCMMFLCLMMTLSAQEGVRFRDLSYSEALKQAKAENKWVFMDCYTSWCGPCRRMAEKVFTQKTAGDYFNPRFVCVKFDMEKGEGVELAKRLEVKSYPSFYIICPDGSIRHKIVGGGELDEFIGRVEKGLHEKTSWQYWQQRYEAGNVKNKNDLMACYCVMEEASENEKASELYQRIWPLLTDKERVKPAYWQLYESYNCRLDSPQWEFLLAHLEDIRRHTGREKVDRYLQARYGKILKDLIEGFRLREKILFEELSKQILLINLEELTKMLPLANLVVNQKTEELAALIEQKLPDCSLDTLVFYASGFRGISLLCKGKASENWIKCGNRLAASALQRMERESDTLTAVGLLDYLNMLFCFQQTLDPELCRQIVVIVDKVLPQLPEDKDLANVKQQMEQVRGKIENP